MKTMFHLSVMAALSAAAMSGFAQEHAAAQQGNFIGVFLSPHLGQGMNDRGRIFIPQLIVDSQARPLRIDCLQQGQLTRTFARVLAIVPGHHAPLLDVGLGYRWRQPIVVQQLGVTVPTQKQVAPKACSQAERIYPEVGQVHQMDWIAQEKIIPFGRRLELLPKTLATLVTSFSRKHCGPSPCNFNRSIFFLAKTRCKEKLPASIRPLLN